MSTANWVDLLGQHRPMTPERLRAELQWQELTGSAPAGLPPLPATWWAPPAPAPRAPRGKGRRKPKATRPVLVERKSTRLLSMPDGSRLAVKRTAHSYIIARP